MSDANRRSSNLTWQGRQTFVDEKPVRLLSGAIHYFRTLAPDWEDRLLKLKALGCNTVETYVPWNLHEPYRGEFRFDGHRDLEQFVDLAAQLDLHVLLRPGPYICAEWDFGGLPWWLLERDNARVRCSDTSYLGAVKAWWDELLPRVVPRLSTKGGPILAVQVENEYGYFGHDPKYLQHLKQLLVAGGVDVPLFTSDLPTDEQQTLGGIEGVLRTGNFGDDAMARLDTLARHQPDGPLSCMEYWVGWFDAWGKPGHSSRPAADVAKVLDDMLKRDTLVNFYVFHGGTNFGLTSGGNCSDAFEPYVTSYDYDALLSECGDTTAKYDACRKVVKSHGFMTSDERFEPAATMQPRDVLLDRGCKFQAAFVDKGVRSTAPVRMEKLGHGIGFAHYEATVPTILSGSKIVLREMRDIATIMLNGKVLGMQYRNDLDAGTATEIRLPTLEAPAHLEVLVENLGRANFGHRMTESKGIDGSSRGGVLFGDRRHDERAIFDWHSRAMPMESVEGLTFGDELPTGPGFFAGHFDLEDGQIGDAYLAVPGAERCIVFLNGFNLGRLWHIGPQRTLYAPRHLFRSGKNEVVVFESAEHKTVESARVELRDRPDIGA